MNQQPSKHSQFDARNISMLMDLYELTMANGYHIGQKESPRSVFDLFYRRIPDRGGFAIFAGLEQVIDFVEQLHFSAQDIGYLRSLNLFDEQFLDYLSRFRFSGDIYAFPEGSIIYPNEPVITVVASLIEAQIIETALLTLVNHQSLIATKASRIVRAAQGRPVADMGARRAHNIDAALYGARAAYIGGVSATATVLAGQIFNIPVVGTMAHSWVMVFENEYEAFCQYARIYGDETVLLVDTYNTLASGVPNAIRTAKEVLEPTGKKLKGIRIDSGDIAYLSKKARKMLNEAGLHETLIMGSNSLDEWTITSILAQGGCIDSFGVGERLITAHSDATFGAVYKLVAIEENGIMIPKIKLSNNLSKTTHPAWKEVYRVYEKSGKAIADLISLKGEAIPAGKEYPYIYPQKPWEKRSFGADCTMRKMQQQVVRTGKRTLPCKTLVEIRNYVQQQLSTEIWQEEQRFENPHVHYLDMSPKYHHCLMTLVREYQKEEEA